MITTGFKNSPIRKIKYKLLVYPYYQKTKQLISYLFSKSQWFINKNKALKPKILSYFLLLAIILPIQSQAMLVLPNFSPALKIEYELLSLGNQRYRYTYTLTNQPSSSGQTSVQLFDIFFDKALYDTNSLTITTANHLQSVWNENILFSVTGVIPIYDASSTTGLADGQSVSGFTVEFTWLGNGQPSSQPFEVYDLNNFALLQLGTTELRQSTNPPINTNPPVNNNSPASLRNVPSLTGYAYIILVGFMLILAYRSFYLKSLSAFIRSSK